jgi:hypothetical protein
LPVAIAAAATAAFALFLVLPGLQPAHRSVATPDVIGAVPSVAPTSGGAATLKGPIAAAPSAVPSNPSVSPTLPQSGEGEPGRLDTTAERLNVWEDAFGAVRAEIVVTVRNSGGSPVAVRISSARWAVRDNAGRTVASGRFSHAFPPVVQPGANAYLIDGVSSAFAEPDELAHLDVEIDDRPVDEIDETVSLELSELSWDRADDGGIQVICRVTNPSDQALADTHAAVVLSGERGEILAAVYDVAIGALGPGESRQLDTAYPGTPPVEPQDVTTVDGVAIGFP